jgi:hypothetical protein
MDKRSWKGLVLAAALVALALAALPAGAEAPQSLAGALDALSIGEPESHEGLTLIPLLGEQGGEAPRLLTLEQALERGWLEIVEKEGGTVPEVWLTNRSERLIFIMGGEILSGARQDRIVQRDLIVGPWRKRLSVPVFCVEHGRWHPVSKSFGSEKNLGTYKLRAKAQAARPAAQQEIWSEVAQANERLGVSSESGAYQDAYRDTRVAGHLQSLEKSLLDLARRYPDAVGVIVGSGDRIISLDLFATPELFRELWPKILKSTAYAYLEEAVKGKVSRKQAAELLRELGRGVYQAQEGLDLGLELLLDSPRWSARALTHRQALVHLAVFPQEQEGPRDLEEE